MRLSGSVSSQYLTALLMAAPLATGGAGVDIIITDELVSKPYVDMTVRLMERFGVSVRHSSGKSCNHNELEKGREKRRLLERFDIPVRHVSGNTTGTNRARKKREQDTACSKRSLSRALGRNGGAANSSPGTCENLTI